MFRPDAEPLLPNWLHMPVGYHGRAGTVVASGTPVVRPSGQRGPGDFGPTQALDIELEVGFVIGVASEGPVPIERALDHVFGAVLLNDWSARDIQGWEYRPLGPLLGKSFATSVSRWVVPVAELERFRVDAPPQDPEPLPYLREAPWAFDMALEIELNGAVVSRSNTRHLYWSIAQQIAHLTSNGASLRVGDLLGTGHDLGARARAARVPAGAVLGGKRADRAARRIDADVPRGRRRSRAARRPSGRGARGRAGRRLRLSSALRRTAEVRCPPWPPICSPWPLPLGRPATTRR